jgi:cell pole-organizing protein PopZ
MVIDDEPPVLDLTDVVKPDGSIVKVKKTDSENSDMGSFLKLVQENASLDYENKFHKEEYIAQQLQKAPIISADVSSSPVTSSSEKQPDKNETIPNPKSMEEISASLINKWINNNLPDIAKKVVEEKIRELLKKHPAE